MDRRLIKLLLPLSGFLFSNLLQAQLFTWIQPESQEMLIYQELKLRQPEKFSSQESYPFSWKEYFNDKNQTPSFNNWNNLLNQKYTIYTVKDSSYLTLANAGSTTISRLPLSTKVVRMTDYTTISGQINPYLTFSTSVQLDTDASMDNDYKGRVSNAVNDQTINGFLIHKHAYLLTGSNGFEAMFGKQKLSWGPTLTESMMLSDAAPAHDLLWFRYSWNFIRLTHFWSMLDHHVYDPQGNLTQKEELVRHLLGTRIELQLGERWAFGVSQTNLFATEGFGINLSYLNPLTSYFGEHQNNGLMKLDDNIAYQADLSYRRPGLFSFGSLFIDDVSLDGTDNNKLGLQLGGEISDPILNFPSTFSAQFTVIAPKVYTVKSNNGPIWLNYVVYSKMLDYDKKDLNRGSILGNSLGPDSWQFFLRHRLWNYYPFWYETTFVYQSLGKKNTLLPLSTNPLKEFYDYDEQHIRIKFSLNYDYQLMAKFSSFIIFSDIRNPNHQSGRSQDFNIGINAQFDVYAILHLKNTLFNF